MTKATTGKADFFQGKVTMCVGPDAKPDYVEGVRRQLESLTFHVDFVPCESPRLLSIYHQGDCIAGARLKQFLDYANWLRKA